MLATHLRGRGSKGGSRGKEGCGDGELHVE